MLNRQDVVVAVHPQGGDKFLPPFSAVAVAAGAEDPAAVALVSVGLGVENAGADKVGRIELGILGMDVKDGVAEDADGADGIDALPEHVTGIVVTADGGPGDLAQAQHGFRTVDDEAGVHLDGDADAVVGCKFCFFDPVGRHHGFPLPLEDVAVFRRPGAGDPVG